MTVRIRDTPDAGICLLARLSRFLVSRLERPVVVVVISSLLYLV